MTLLLAIKAVTVWGVIAACAIANGLVREKLLVPHLGQAVALPASGIVLCLVVFTITYVSIPFLGKHAVSTYVLLGMQWVLMTLLFELIVGHYVIGKSWQTLFQEFNILKGNLMVLVLLVSLLAPYGAAKLRRLV